MPKLQPAALLGGGSFGRWLFRLVRLHDSTPECVCQHYGVRFGELHKALRSATVQFAQAAQDRAGSPAQAADHQPGSRSPARQQDTSPAAGRQPGSYVIYAPARAGAPAPRRSNVPACVRGRAGTARAPAGYAGSEARKLGRYVIFFGISVRAGRKKWGLKLSGKG